MSAREVATIDARAELKTALLAREVAREALANARAAADRAGELLASAETRLYQFSMLDKQIEHSTASRIAAWARDGGQQPSLDPDPKFADDLRRRTEAQQRFGAARSAVATLAAALDAAERKFSASEFAVAHAATKVMIEQAQPLAERLMSARREAWALEASLAALAGMWFPTASGAARPISVSVEIRDALANKEPPWRAPGAQHEGGEAWRALRAALVGGDADATLERAS